MKMLWKVHKKWFKPYFYYLILSKILFVDRLFQIYVCISFFFLIHAHLDIVPDVEVGERGQPLVCLSSKPWPKEIKNIGHNK